MSDWKEEFGNRATECLAHELVQDVEEEFVFNMRGRGVDLSTGLPAYGLHKVMRTVAVVASAVALGIDPDTLRLSREEADEAIVAQARAFAARGGTVIAIDPATPPDEAARIISERLSELGHEGEARQ